MAPNESKVRSFDNFKYESPSAKENFTISSEDKAKLEQFVKELSDLAEPRSKLLSGYATNMIFDVFVHKKVDVLVNILRNDDGIVDAKELELLVWYINIYLPKSESNPAYPEAAVNVVDQGLKEKVKNFLESSRANAS